jgi:hypothetical protein
MGSIHRPVTAFGMAITTDFEAQSAELRELVLRLASLLWRLRRATAIESGFVVWASHGDPDDLTSSFVRLSNLPTYPLDRLSRYEATLWRQACQNLFALQFPKRRKANEGSHKMMMRSRLNR